ncbi:MAG: TetR/AcrR family transcriptional regulator [Deltaproteobacteria bacterium]|nr:TetR/AcrR family transcriptional regulator [Deltaproteobacteria bacterium]
MIKNIEEPNSLREGILNAASVLFSRFGFKKTAVDDIARKARVAKGTIYNYFQSKEEIFQNVVQREGATLISRMREAVLSQKTPQLKFREMIITKINYYKELSLLYEINRQKAEELLPFIENERDEIARQEMEIIKEILEDGVSSSVFQVINIPATAKAMVVAIKGLEIGWTLDMDMEAAIAEIDGLLQIFFRGLESRSTKG